MKGPVAIATERLFAAPPAQVWPALVFYEDIEHEPSWPLRLLLPRAIRSEGPKDVVGSVVRCSYVDGHLLKRMTEVREQRLLAFEVIEQTLELAGKLRLAGGSMDLEPAGDRETRLVITTSYLRPNGRHGPLRRAVESRCVHAFHRHLLEGIARRIAQPGAGDLGSRPARGAEGQRTGGLDRDLDEAGAGKPAAELVLLDALAKDPDALVKSDKRVLP